MRNVSVHDANEKRRQLYHASYIVFNDSMKSGVSLIDDQHEMLISLTNTLYYNIQGRCGKSIALAVFTAFKHQMSVHHGTERTVLDFCEPAYGELYEMHYEEVCRGLLKAECLLKRDIDPVGLLDFLKIWWLRHTDMHGECFLPGCSANVRFH